MPVELRKRKAPAAPPPEPPAKKQSKVSKAAAKVKDAVVRPRGRPAKATAAAAPEAEAEPAATAAATNGATSGKPEVGQTISLDGFGGEVETNKGDKTTLKALVDESKAGVVLFTYPKASTPGCTRQACLFRDAYAPLTATGLAIYGLSTDSPKANTTFQDKQKLPYPLLCDPAATLIAAIGLKKTPKGTTRGVFVVDKSGKVLAAEPGGPEATVAVVKRVVEQLAGPGAGEAAAVEEAAAPVVAAEKAEAADDKAGNADGEGDQKVTIDAAAANGDGPKETAEDKVDGEEKKE
ncbi:peroxiredoxin DOT5 [Echria macrotheca]|uniref:thioredoxin-dependent peroxiredoxin n=1 Tax=Echria macrotheca TaxID=438768 RepID=A0AAJ0BEM8_9PEZI|nr:peroxiredoxin DOT5 [Echria macrotheca]